MIKRSLAMRLRHISIGCGVQGGDCLALAVSGKEGAWRIAWSLLGRMDDPVYARQLRKQVWRRPLWAPPYERREVTHMTVCGIDLSFEGEKSGGLRQSEIRAAFRTQLLGRFTHASGEPVLCGLQLDGPAGERHLVGGARPRELIRHDYVYWCNTMGIIHPHIGSPAAALANLYLALYPQERRREMPCRLVVLEGRESTMAALMLDWRLLDAIQFQMMVDQQLDEVLLGQWASFLSERNHMEVQPIPCVIKYDTPGTTHPAYECWSPFWESTAVTADEATRNSMDTNPDLASLAFGMALQGG